MKRDRREEEKKKKSQEGAEPKPSAAAPCHISAEHESRAVRSGNGVGLSRETQPRRCCCCCGVRADVDVAFWGKPPAAAAHGGRPVHALTGRTRDTRPEPTGTNCASIPARFSGASSTRTSEICRLFSGILSAAAWIQLQMRRV